MSELETLKAQMEGQWTAFKSSEAETRRLCTEWAETHRRVEFLEQQAEIERLVAERLASK